jgi:RNA polymerase sigma-70 factor (ECF subfamily)
MVRLLDQDRGRWDRELIDEGHALVRACLRHNQPGRFQIQAAIAAVHADADAPDRTDWTQIVALYDQLYALRPDAVVALNRAGALANARGPAAGLRTTNPSTRCGPISSPGPAGPRRQPGRTRGPSR